MTAGAGVVRRLCAAFLLLASLGACASIARLPPPPAERVVALPVLGVADARFFADGDPAPLRDYLGRLIERQRAARPPPPGLRDAPVHFLALSGGADDGAFGAGVVTGWTESGARPRFDMVTGISAGALIAPFAFLGPAYDERLRQLFTEIAPTDVLRVGRITLALLFREAIADTSPLAALIQRHADAAMLEAIAAEYARGRLLLIGTVNIDLGRPVVWNIGAIAASGDPRALDLFRSILLASASIPGAFPPVLLDVEVDGRRFQEMHVDGGAATQVFLYPPGLAPRSIRRQAGLEREATAWVIRNGRVDVTAFDAPRGLFSITARSAQTLLHFSGVGDLNQIYLTAERDGVRFRMQSIGREFNAPHTGFFEPDYMRALFAYGQARGRDPASWASAPPPVGLVMPVTVPPAQPATRP
jgi:hypothetical protein